MNETFKLDKVILQRQLCMHRSFELDSVCLARESFLMLVGVAFNTSLSAIVDMQLEVRTQRRK